VEPARTAGATDKEIRDTVLIAAAFCMFNRYVDGLATCSRAIPKFIARSASRLPSSATSAATTQNRSNQSLPIRPINFST
jgi:hypothetical protein